MIQRRPDYRDDPNQPFQPPPQPEIQPFQWAPQPAQGQSLDAFTAAAQAGAKRLFTSQPEPTWKSAGENLKYPGQQKSGLYGQASRILSALKGKLS